MKCSKNTFVLSLLLTHDRPVVIHPRAFLLLGTKGAGERAEEIEIETGLHGCTLVKLYIILIRHLEFVCDKEWVFSKEIVDMSGGNGLETYRCIGAGVFLVDLLL